MVRSTKIFGFIGLALVIIGLIGWCLQMAGGLLAGSGMTNIFLWGLMIAMFAFMVGFGAGSQLVATVIYLWGPPETKKLARTAAAVGLACVGAAGVAILIDLGAIRNILAMIFGLNLRSPLAWDMIAISAFIVLSIIELLAIARDWSSIKIWAAIAGVAAVALQVVEGLLFSTQSAHSWWATPIMPVDFLAVAFVSGSALMLLIACVKGSNNKTVSWLSLFCAIAIAVHLVLAVADLLLVIFEGTPQAGGVLAAISADIVLYILELALPAIAMIMLFVLSKKGNSVGCLIAAIIAIVGIFCHRLMLLYPSYNAPSLYLQLSGTDATTGPYPVSTGRYLDWDSTFALTTPYMPAGLEWIAALLPIGVAIVATFILLWIMEKIGKHDEAVGKHVA